MRLRWGLAWLLLVSVASLQAQSRFANGIVAVVNDVVITWNEVTNHLGPAVELLQRQWADDPATLDQKVIALQKERIEELVARQLILHDFTNAGFRIPESIIEDQVQQRIRDDFGDRVTLTKTLQGQGITYETFRRNLREGIIVGYLQEQHVSRELMISPYKIEKYYLDNKDKYQVQDQVKLRMIVIAKTAENSSLARPIAEEVVKKLDNGATFAEMAGVYSDGSQRAQGGDWGWVERSVLKKELADVAFGLKPGARSEIIETPEACFIMLIEEARLKHVKPVAEVREEIDKALLAQERQRLYQQWIDRLKAKSFVRYYY
ncbi:MAG TPA: peptidylprolyl isomerase [Candidatus Paceibacterota bacterium]|nr:peptidylprolyl isomerase [Verrucomicrobiota bacterium]HRZ43892.1 peptidylprolyl isomerase [Candidatus Paceibacterota bacterium]HRZ92065.1 peptidylprolyl isomerase [Candidatus Paceibacterota bacterium]